ncbi:MAG: DUF692 domain-containing protein [Xanthomonadales bacterium]|nr:DUF692 domain-containing protein [Xanthomonadales bacterium]
MSATARPALAAVRGTGLGLRRGLLDPLESVAPGAIDFLEIAPENWIGVGGRLGRRFRGFCERYPLSAHGLSLSLGGPEPLDAAFLARLRRFLDEHGIAVYSEHLSYCSDHGQLYDLMPIPFTMAAVRRCAARIGEAQDRLGRRVAIENISFYAPLAGEMSERDFVLEVLRAADCDLLLDVNNVYVNSVNHGYDATGFIRAMPADRVSQFHVAGHYQQSVDLIVDTHGAAVIDPVFDLLAEAYRCFGPRPTLLERDFNFPPIADLLAEIGRIRALQLAAQPQQRFADVA